MEKADNEEDDENFFRNNEREWITREGGRENFFRNFLALLLCASYEPAGILEGLPAGELAVLVPLHASLLASPGLVFRCSLPSFLPSFPVPGAPFPRAPTFLPHQARPRAVKRSGDDNDSGGGDQQRNRGGWAGRNRRRVQELIK
jgi:hypothetical protein